MNSFISLGENADEESLISFINKDIIKMKNQTQNGQ
jgi:hypothetical protein